MGAYFPLIRCSMSVIQLAAGQHLTDKHVGPRKLLKSCITGGKEQEVVCVRDESGAVGSFTGAVFSSSVPFV